MRLCRSSGSHEGAHGDGGLSIVIPPMEPLMATHNPDEALSPIVALHGIATPTVGDLNFSVTTPCSQVNPPSLR